MQDWIWCVNHRLSVTTVGLFTSTLFGRFQGSCIDTWRYRDDPEVLLKHWYTPPKDEMSPQFPWTPASEGMSHGHSEATGVLRDRSEGWMSLFEGSMLAVRFTMVNSVCVPVKASKPPRVWSTPKATWIGWETGTIIYFDKELHLLDIANQEISLGLEGCLWDRLCTSQNRD